MKLSELKAGDGKKQKLRLPIISPYPIEITVICGRKPGKSLVVTAGVHGCEYVGIEALRSLCMELNPDDISGRVILLPLVNPEGFYQGAKQIIPTDKQNLNRMFPGNKAGSFSSQLAKSLEETLYQEADFFMDLHGGDVNEALTPLIFFPTAVPEKLMHQTAAAAAALSVSYRVASTAKNGLYSWAAQCGIPSLLVERGERGLWSQREVEACKKNVYEMMWHLGMIGEARMPDTAVFQTQVSALPPDQVEIRETFYEESPCDGFWYPAMMQAGQFLSKGDLIGTLKDFAGEEMFRCIAPFDGVILYYTLSLGVKAGDPLTAFGRIEK